MQSDGITASFKKGGSHYSSDMPYIKVEILLSSQYPMERVIDAIFSVDERKKWDKNILQQEKTAMSVKRCFVNYQMITSAINLPNRDFYDKCIEFSDSGRFYSYESTIPNDHLVLPPPEGVERCKTIISNLKIERRKDDGKLEIVWLYQCKVKKVNMKLMPMTPPTILEWGQKLNEYL